MKKILFLIIGLMILLVGCEELEKKTVEAVYLGDASVGEHGIVKFDVNGKKLNLFWYEGGIPMIEGEIYKVTYHDDEDFINELTVLDIEAVE